MYCVPLLLNVLLMKGKLDELHTFLSCLVLEFLKLLWWFSEARLLIALSLSLKYFSIWWPQYTEVATQKNTELLKQLYSVKLVHCTMVNNMFRSMYGYTLSVEVALQNCTQQFVLSMVDSLTTTEVSDY